jgi:DNA/RNA endonuclease YhcR with UshA esterase domain
MPVEESGEQTAKKISLKYEGRCIKCGRAIPAGDTAYWEKDRGVWHIDCAIPTKKPTQRRRDQVSRNLWAITAGSVFVAFILGGLVLGPGLTPNIAYFPARTVEQQVTLTVTEISLMTITQAPTETPPTSAPTDVVLAQKWINPSDSNVVSWADASKYVGKTKTVEGTIVRTYRSSTNTIFLNFHDPYQGYFYAVIFASDLKSFPFKPEDFYRGKEVRITGLIKLYQGSPEIIVENPSQIEVANMGYDYP